MASYERSFDSALKSEFEIKFDGYELFELYQLLYLSTSPHLRALALDMHNVFFDRVATLNCLPFDDVEPFVCSEDEK